MYVYMCIDFQLPNDFNLQSVTSPCILKQKLILYYIHSSLIRIYISRYNCLYLRFQHIRSPLPFLMYYLSNDLCFHQTIFTGKVWFFLLLLYFEGILKKYITPTYIYYMQQKQFDILSAPLFQN